MSLTNKSVLILPWHCWNYGKRHDKQQLVLKRDKSTFLWRAPDCSVINRKNVICCLSLCYSVKWSSGDLKVWEQCRVGSVPQPCSWNSYCVKRILCVAGLTRQSNGTVARDSARCEPSSLFLQAHLIICTCTHLSWLRLPCQMASLAMALLVLLRSWG